MATPLRSGESVGRAADQPVIAGLVGAAGAGATETGATRLRASAGRSAVARAAGWARVAPVAGIAAVLPDAGARAAAIAGVRAHAGATRRSRRRRAADQATSARVPRAGRAPATDVRAMIRRRRLRAPGSPGERRKPDGSSGPKRRPARPIAAEPSRHRVEALSVHRCLQLSIGFGRRRRPATAGRLPSATCRCNGAFGGKHVAAKAHSIKLAAVIYGFRQSRWPFWAISKHAGSTGLFRHESTFTSTPTKKLHPGLQACGRDPTLPALGRRRPFRIARVDYRRSDR